MRGNNTGAKARLKIAQLKEDSFRKLFKNTQLPTKKQDMFEHWDVQVNFKVDVKGLKKVKMKDKKPDENVHWIEIKNVLGNKGWLYGEADFFAFETHKYWIVVPKVPLQDWVAKNVSKEFFSHPEMYKLYSRAGRQDIITLVSSHDLYFLSEVVLEKEG